MSKFNQIIDELLLEHSQTYPFPSLDDKEQVKHLMECCDKLGYSEYKDIIKEFFLNEKDEQAPKPQPGKEGESKDFPGKFHLGGGYYSSTQNGAVEFKNDNGNLRVITPDEKAEFEKKNQSPNDSKKVTSPIRKVASVAKDAVGQHKEKIQQKIQNWSESEKEFFNKGQENAGSETRRTFAEALKDKVKGAANAIKHGFQHEVELFKHAAGAAGKLFKGEPLEKEDKKALIKVGIKVATTALTGAAFGGLSHGAAAFAKHVAVEFVPHVVAETIAVGAARASLFADTNADERVLMDFADKIAEGLENLEMNPEIMDSIVDKWNNQRTTEEESTQQTETTTLDELLESIMLNEGEGESSKFPGKFHLGGGYYSSKEGGDVEFKNDNGNLRPVTAQEKEEFQSKGVGDSKQSELEKTAEKALEDKEKEVEDENKPDVKDNPEKILNDPNASAKDRAKARAFKANKDNLERRREDDVDYQREQKQKTKEKIGEISLELRGREGEDGNILDSETTENGSLLIGVEHGENNESTKDAIDKIKSLPKNTKVMFVGEGGSTRDGNDSIEFADEQKEFRDATLSHFDRAKETSWDENANINDDSSPVFDSVAKEFGGKKAYAKASIWTNMVGQGDDLNADDYLTDETKDWIINQAKKGGSSEFDGKVDWNNLTLEQKEDLYQLNYRDDKNYGETEIFKGQKAYNDFRQSELDRKIKEAEDSGYVVIAPMGNSHVGMWRERNKKVKDTFNPSSLRTLNNELPDADKEVFTNQSDIDKIPDSKKEEISMKIDELADKANKGEDFNLCQVTVPGTNLYCDGNQGIPREEMPQFKGKPLPGTPAADMPKDASGEVDTEPLFKKMLKDKGIKTVETKVPSDRLKATQSELVGTKVAGMAKALEEDPNHPKITAPIYVSRDGFVIDGHHRWAAVTSAAIKAGKPADMKVIVVDMDIKDAIPMCNKFAEDQGIAAKKADANDGTKEEQPKPKEADKTPNQRVYNVGGNYYSDTPNGPAQYIKTESVVEKIFIDEDERFFNLIFESVVTKTDGNGNPIKLTVIDPKDQPEATDNAETIEDPKNLEDLLSAIGDNSNTIKAKEAVKNGAKAITDQLDKLANDPKNTNSESHKKVKELMGNIFAGEKVSEDDTALLNQYIRIAEPTEKNPDTAKYYIAKEPGNFKGTKRVKVEVGGKGAGTPTYAAFRNFTEKAGLSRMSASTFGTKLTTANQTFVDENGKTKLIKGENDTPLASVEKDESGKIISVNIGETQIKRLDSNEPNITDEEKKMRERNNRNMDEYSKAIEKGDLQFIDMDNGVTPNTPENRVIVIKGAISGMADRLRTLAKKGSVSDNRIYDIIDQMDTFAERDPNDNPKQWFVDFKALMSSVANDEGEPSLKECWANYAEVYSAIVLMHDEGNGTQNGACALLPESTTLETVDVITINTNGAGERRIVTLDGKSVKKGVGGASALTSKTMKSTYKDDPDGTKKEAIIKMSESHGDIYRMKLDDDMNSHIDFQNEYRTGLIDKAKELGVTDEFISNVQNNLKEPNGAWKSVSAALKQIEIQREKKGKSIDSETMGKIRLRLESYYMYSQISHEVYNTNVDVQDFSNDSILSQADDRGGSQLVKDKDIKIDSSNGVTILAYIRPEFNIGSWGDEGRSGNAGAGRFHNAPKR